MADRRTLVSYDDISTPHDAGSAQLGPPLPSTNQLPAKKRRKTHQKAPPKRMHQHWDDPGNTGDAMNYGGATHDDETQETYVEEEEESRELTHGEIWDDSALIDAWNSATAEYEAYHGKEKKWKAEAVKKSPLWYNVPPSSFEPVNGNSTSPTTNGSREVKAEDSTPLNFDTFVPTHDATLAAGSQASQAPGQPNEYPQSYLPAQGSNGALASRDEAFEKALNAMYWTGYWTAVYHSNGRVQAQNGGTAEEDEEAASDHDDAVMDDDLVETQR